MDYRERPAHSDESKGHARSVPDEMVDRRLRRSLPDSSAGIAIWLDTGEPRPLGDLIRKRSLVQVHVPHRAEPTP